MRQNSSRMLAAALAAVAQLACTDNPTAVGSPDLSVREARPAAPPPPSITVISLGTLPNTVDASGAGAIAMALNNGATRADTRAAGYTAYGATRFQPFTWTQGTGMVPLDRGQSGYAWPYGLSDNGITVGEGGTTAGNRAFSVTAGGSMSYLPVLPNTTSSAATGISADGACISGSNSTSAGGNAVLWRNGVEEVVAPGSATGVSNDCMVVSGNTGGHAAVWRNVAGTWTLEQLPSNGAGTTTPNGSILYSESTDISPNGEYVAGRRLDGKYSYAVVWRHTSSGWTPTDMPGKTVYAFGVDNSGRAVGHNSSSEPMVWTRGSDGTYMSQLLPPLERSTLGWPAAINELGQVSGRSRSRADGWVPVIWTIL